ncbi:hypothetical protein [Agrobacterium cavarae]|uniref:hypothetical protein n=1 Tax=Agrobacterium cavarae TaxID=2528239 RepID=UPI000DDDEE15|nr:hypothetical protein [Agrobacterium cavarae]
MDYKTYRFVDDLFLVVAGGDDVLEKAIASHVRLKHIVEEALKKNGEHFQSARGIVSAVNRIVEQYRQFSPIDGIYYVVALAADRLDMLEEADGSTLSDYFNPIIAGYRLECRDFASGEQPRVLEELISLISWKTMSSGPESIHSIIQPKLEIFERDVKARAEELASVVSEHRALFSDQQLLHSQAAEATVRAEKQLIAAGHIFEQKALEMEDRSQEIDADIRQLRADLDAQVAKFGTEAARKLWGEREKQSRFALIASSIAIFCLIAAPIIGAICFTTEVLHYLAQIVAASSLPTTDTTGQVLPAPNDTQITIAAIGRLVIVTVPVFLYIWAIRLVVRFNSRSLMLLDDARLRLTMLDTFFHLIEKEGAVKEDRALVLNALFRPGPGHGDNVDPPNFTELVTKAMGSTPGK